MAIIARLRPQALPDPKERMLERHTSPTGLCGSRPSEHAGPTTTALIGPSMHWSKSFRFSDRRIRLLPSLYEKRSSQHESKVFAGSRMWNVGESRSEDLLKLIHEGALGDVDPLVVDVFGSLVC